MYKKYSILIILTLVISILGISTKACINNHTYVTDLIAGQHYDAGDVIVWDDCDFIYVKFTTENGWMLSETHLHIATSLDGIPQNNGNPTPGQFDYKTDHNPMVTWFEYKIKNIWGSCTEVYIAAHAIVCKGDIISGGLDDLETSLPDQVTVLAEHAYLIPPFNESYFKFTLSGRTSLDGTYNGWCADTDHLMNLSSFLANVYPSYESIPVSLIEKPYNLDLVNYIINQHFVGKPSNCDGDYTYGDVQRAIWELIEDEQSSISYLGPWSECRANEIIADALANGEGFIPGCDQAVAIILEPACTIGQVGIIEVPIPCKSEPSCETAWGNGTDFPGKNWAMYFTYNINCCNNKIIPKPKCLFNHCNISCFIIDHYINGKDLHKFFLPSWNGCEMPIGINKILMRHSIHGGFC